MSSAETQVAVSFSRKDFIETAMAGGIVLSSWLVLFVAVPYLFRYENRNLAILALLGLLFTMAIGIAALWQRYRRFFPVRNLNGDEGVGAMAQPHLSKAKSAADAKRDRFWDLFWDFFWIPLLGVMVGVAANIAAWVIDLLVNGTSLPATRFLLWSALLFDLAVAMVAIVELVNRLFKCAAKSR